MSTPEERAEARTLRETLYRLRGGLPASLRAPCQAVIEGTEVEGTAAGVLECLQVCVDLDHCTDPGE